MSYQPSWYCIKAFYHPRKYIWLITTTNKLSRLVDDEFTSEQTFVSLELLVCEGDIYNIKIIWILMAVLYYEMIQSYSYKLTVVSRIPPSRILHQRTFCCLSYQFHYLKETRITTMLTGTNNPLPNSLPLWVRQ